MRKLYTIVFVFFIGLGNLIAQDCGCDHFISSEVVVFDGVDVEAGDVICLEAGTRSRLKIRDLSGTESQPVLIRNCGGDVYVDSPYNPFGIIIENSDYFHLTGSGDGSEFGISISSPAGSGLVLSKLSNHFEVDHIRITDAYGPALIAQNHPTCDLSANEGYFSLENCNLHHLEILNCRLGIIMGHPEFRTGIVSGDCGAIFPHGVENLVISDSEVGGITVGNGIQVYGCSGEISRNIIHNIQGSGIALGTEADMVVKENEIKHTIAYGLEGAGNGTYDVTNNLFFETGVLGTGAAWFEFYLPLGGEEGNVLEFLHNTVVKSGDANVTIENIENATDSCRIHNNILCEPTDVRLEDYEYKPYIYSGSSAMLLIDHNIQSLDFSDQFFVNTADKNFRLTHESPAINYGLETGLETDLDFSDRNLAGAPDAGAYEYIPEPLSYFEALPLVGLYVDDFKNILGDPEAETDLLEYAQSNGFNYLLLYNLAYIHSHSYDLTDPTEAIVLANFIERAKRDYGIAQMGAVGEKDASFDKIEAFNGLYGDNWFQKFDVLNLEFEFWTDPGSDVFGYYCDTYLTPGGYPCTNDGAYAFYTDELEDIDSRAHDMGIISEIYVGYMSDDESIGLAERCDRILLHHYRTSDVYGDGSSIYNYHTYRIRAIALSDRKPAIMPIFSSRSYHMGPWLLDHSLHQPMDTWLHGVEAYDDDFSEGVHELPIAGFQWYRYTSFIDLLPSFAPIEASEEMEAVDSKVGLSQNDMMDLLTVSIDDVENPANLRGELYNLQGAKLADFNFVEGTNQVDLSPFTKGVYILTIHDGSQIIEGARLIKP